MKKKMTVEQFRIWCKKNSNQFVSKWNIDKFKIICQKCLSEKCVVYFEGKEHGHSEYTGMWTSKDDGVLVKCWSCGHAMIIGEYEGGNNEKQKKNYYTRNSI